MTINKYPGNNALVQVFICPVDRLHIFEPLTQLRSSHTGNRIVVVGSSLYIP